MLIKNKPKWYGTFSKCCKNNIEFIGFYSDIAQCTQCKRIFKQSKINKQPQVKDGFGQTVN